MLFNIITTSSTFFSQEDDIIPPKTRGLSFSEVPWQATFLQIFLSFEQAAKIRDKREWF